jgi:hypothetical protein
MPGQLSQESLMDSTVVIIKWSILVNGGIGYLITQMAEGW